PTVLLLCAYSQVLATWSSSKHFALNLTLFNRLPLHEEVQQLVGDFTSSLLLDIEVDASQNFAQRARLIGSRLWRDLDNRLFSGVSVIRELNKLSGGTQQYNMPVVFTSMLGMDSSLDEAGIADQTAELNDDEEAGEEHYSVSQTSQVWLDHQVAEENDGLTLVWDAIDDLFPENMLDDMFSAYCQLLDSLTAAESWQQLTSLTPSSHLQTREDLTQAQEKVDLRLLHQLFEQQVQDHSDSVAIIAGDVTISYSKLEQWSQNLAALLIEKGATPNTLVAIVMDKGWEQVVAAMAILKSGAAYLPINAELPDKRIAELLEDGQCQLVLTQQNTLIADRVQAWSNGHVKLTDLVSTIISSDSLDLLPDRKVEQQVNPTDIAYVIFTSGSTGKPKGVVIDHRGAVNTIVDINRRFNVTSRDRVLAISSLSFDLSVYDIFGLLAVGGALVVPVGEQRHSANDWFKLALEHDITIWNSVPALMQLLVEHCESSADEFLAKLSLIMMSGDWIPVELPDRIQQLSSSCKVVSLGGATEASIWSIFHEINQSSGHLSSIPYGKPLTNQRFFVLDEEGSDCPNWVRGHLFIGGIGVAKGYWQDAEKTAHSFVQHEKYGLLYRTGDLGRYDDQGVIEFMGREDSQVKVQGYRVELGEIESALSQHPEISNSVVLAQGDRFSKTLVAYVVPQAGEIKSDDALIVDPVARSLFKLEHKGIRQLPSSLTKLALPSIEKIGCRPAYELGADERSGFVDRFKGNELLPTLGALLSGLRQERIDSSPLPKYFYPSASSLYPIQLYLAIPTSINEEFVSDEEKVILYYFSAPECALLQLGRMSTDLIAAVSKVVMERDPELPTLYWVVDWDAITPMYPKDEAQRFVHLEIGYMLAIVRQQLAGLGGGLDSCIDLRWVSGYDPFAGVIIDAELTEAGMTLLPESADCLLVGQIVDQSIQTSAPDKKDSCLGPAKRILDGLLNCTLNIDLADSFETAGGLTDASYDVLKRQSMRRFTNQRVGLTAITGLLECCNYLAKSSLAILLFCKPQRCDDGLVGFYSYDASERQLRKAATGVKEEELIELYSGDNQSIFNDSAFALYFLSNADGQQAAELTHIGEASQHLMSRSWHFGLGLCPIGQVDQGLLNQLLGAETGADNELLMLHGFVGGGITLEQLDVWEPEGTAAQAKTIDFAEQTDALKAFL
ncbi:MAG: amino acid adenylation domain-containing protein, partial [Arenicella sp.]|nr:amino acid adenylation domain-containing protein [Arenicella sp.]